MSTGPVELQGITIVAPIKATLQGVDYRRNILKGVTIAVGTGAQIMQLKVVDRNHEPIEGATCRVLNAIGVSNNVLSFDGVDDKVQTPDVAYDISTSFSIEAWIYKVDNTNRAVLMRSRGTAATNFWHFWIYNNCFRFQRFNASGAAITELQGTTILPNDSWIHLAATFDSTIGSRTYINGVLEKSDSNTTLNKSGTGESPMIGAYMSVGSSLFYKGIISEVRIWETARTQQNIVDNMNNRLVGDEAGIAAYWKLDEGTGAAATDSAGSNDGTIYGATWAEADENFPLYSSGVSYDTETPYDSQTTNANGLTTLNYQINKIHGLEVTLPGKRRFIMPFQRTTRGQLDWQVMLSDYLATFATDKGNILINSEPENNDANFLIE